MNDINYKPNSHRSKEEEKSVEEKKVVSKVIQGTVKKKKKSEIRKFADIFISEDAKNVKSYVIEDVLVPTVKKTISDVVTNVVDIVLFGGGRRSKPSSTASKISYTRYYDQRDSGHRYADERRTKTGYSYDDIILETIGEAEEVLSRMDELIETYGMVSVADLYDLVGVSGDYTDNKYGWVNLRNAKPVRMRDGGYMLDLPKALPLN